MWTVEEGNDINPNNPIYDYWDLCYRGERIAQFDMKEDANQLCELLNQIELKPRSQR